MLQFPSDQANLDEERLRTIFETIQSRQLKGESEVTSSGDGDFIIGDTLLTLTIDALCSTAEGDYGEEDSAVQVIVEHFSTRKIKISIKKKVY